MSNLRFDGTLLLYLVILTAYVLALKSLLQRPCQSSRKVIWAMIILISPLIGALAFFVFGGAENQTEYR